MLFAYMPGLHELVSVSRMIEVLVCYRIHVLSIHYEASLTYSYYVVPAFDTAGGYATQHLVLAAKCTKLC